MLNERIDILSVAGVDLVQLRFDLADSQLLAIARGLETVVGERYRGTSLDADAVLAMRELTAVQDCARERSEDGYNGGTLVLGVPRLGALIDALAEWAGCRLGAGFVRRDEAIDLPVVQALLGDLHDVQARGLAAAPRELAPV